LNIFNADKSVGGHVKKSITSSFFNRITLYLAVRCRRFQKIKVKFLNSNPIRLPRKWQKTLGIHFFAAPLYIALQAIGPSIGSVRQVVCFSSCSRSVAQSIRSAVADSSHTSASSGSEMLPPVPMHGIVQKLSGLSQWTSIVVVVITVAVLCYVLHRRRRQYAHSCHHPPSLYVVSPASRSDGTRPTTDSCWLWTVIEWVWSRRHVTWKRVTGCGVDAWMAALTEQAGRQSVRP